MEEMQGRTRRRNSELSSSQIDQLDAYFYRHDIKLTKKNLKIVSKALNIPHKRIVEYVNYRQKESRESSHEEYIKMMQTLSDINMQIKDIWKGFDSRYK
ncbi:hypothetical protein NEPAR06_2306 [Nematocida parisii]|nr:uncharacterized protein NEPG_02099 [Nematocida parisii ERTm1]KAI5130983.1 hypothetical protein NEPAR08_2289 [Nematocida parisii]EIJ93143.1 hypothetical protein NEPG_02099 [Nematocida parisii ERTm1]KAI5131144.1 hypothetical protein NEPAR03_2303 [Nematocida parisii]KAI5141474.1 hypothetical protein NEPAR04_0975 [Nematocida parisii]KAI5146313.1 hypothetical protein NEPAR07_2281 [Nematocida parisii]|eukprot:XP_013059926.1 hypothetical protein NEPG_02099 [Nematocida parisii ERTm1]